MKNFAMLLTGIPFFIFSVWNAHAESFRVIDIQYSGTVEVSFDSEIWNYGVGEFTLQLGNDKFQTTGYCVELEQGIIGGHDLNEKLSLFRPADVIGLLLDEISELVAGL